MYTVLAQQLSRVVFFVAQLLFVASQLIIIEDIEVRIQSRFQQRVTWDIFVERYKDTPLFRRHLRMSYKSFTNLVRLIQEHVEKNEKMSFIRGGKIIPEVHLYATIRYLAGGLYSDICNFCGISVPTFYTIIWQAMHAINKTIKVQFPTTPEQCANLAAKFEDISFRGIIKNCVSAVDGYLLSTNTPTKHYAKNVRQYFSGHYQKYGINIQASCDADCRFTFLGVGGPGVTKDRTGIQESGLYNRVEGLPQGYICVADCAYMSTEKMIAVFGGDLALKKENDNFNFFISQLRIRIEMDFGLMTRKWGILQHPLTIMMPHIPPLICCIARLHNYY